MRYPGIVGKVIASVSCDGIWFTNFTVTNKDRKHRVADVVAACELHILVG